jgi:hypothetical protein
LGRRSSRAGKKQIKIAGLPGAAEEQDESRAPKANEGIGECGEQSVERDFKKDVDYGCPFVEASLFIKGKTLSYIHFKNIAYL